jgi:hypothetical protein
MKKRTLTLTFLALVSASSACTEEPPPRAPEPIATVAAPVEPVATVAPTAPTVAKAAPTAAPGAEPAAHEGPTPTPVSALAAGVRALLLPGGSPESVGMDYLACDRATGHVWVPAGNTGNVDVIESPDKITPVGGFPTKSVERKGKQRVVGPSSASVGDGVVYVGNRGDSSVCAVDGKTLVRGACVTLDSSPDGLAYVAATKELWVTTPRDKSIRVFDARTPATLKPKSKIALDGEPEGYAVDNKKGVFYTNLEDKDGTLEIDLKSHKVLATWSPKCGEDGPKGLAVDGGLGVVFVACTDHVVALDTAHDGKVLSRLDTGPGVDNFDYLEPKKTLYLAAGKAGKLTVAQAAAGGVLSSLAVVPTSPGARNAVVDAAGNAYVADGPGGRILLVSAPAAAR